jgi:hypothetical protein
VSGVTPSRTARINAVESAHLYLCDIWGDAIHKRPDGLWQMSPDTSTPGSPIIMDDTDLMGLAASQGWRRG